MMVEDWVKLFRPQKTAGISQEKDVAVICKTIVMNGEQFSDGRKINNKTLKCLHTVCPSNAAVLKPRHVKLFWKNVTDAMF